MNEFHLLHPHNVHTLVHKCREMHVCIGKNVHKCVCVRVCVCVRMRDTVYVCLCAHACVFRTGCGIDVLSCVP